MNKILKYWKIILVFTICVLVIIGVFININSFFNYKSPETVYVTIKSGESNKKIATNLKDKKLINSTMLFSIYVWMKHWYLRDGIYKIDQGMTLSQIVSKIHEGKVQENVITIPEGWRAAQIDDYLAKKGIIKEGEFLAITQKDEGYLFPDTYRLALDAKPVEIRNLMIDNFKKRTSGLNLDNQTLIIASIVEREARTDSDRVSIASVYFNRLKIGMKLDADPTIQYAKGSWSQITRSDYQNVKSPYNTYINKGLPPTPICNPGLKSIEAVVNPAKTDFYYFFHKKDGEAVYSKTFEEHTKKFSQSK